MMTTERGWFPCSKYSPAAAGTAVLLSFCILLSLQLFGDPELLRAFRARTIPPEQAKSASVDAAGPSHLHLVAGAQEAALRTETLGFGAQLLGKAASALPAAGGAARTNATLPTAATSHAVLEVINGTEVVYTRVVSPKAVLLLFHGCSHSARDWGVNSSSCPGCLGLPEEMRIVKTARKFAYMPVAFSSADRDTGCWDAQWLDKSQDILAVKQAFAVLSEREGWEKLPRYALGASSGASMVLFLALRMPLDGIVPQIMSLPPHMLEAKPEDPAAAPGKTWAYPPTYFVHMELDRATAQRVTADINVLRAKQGAWVTERLVRPRPLTPTYFSERVEGISAAASRAMHAAFKEAGVINATDYLLEDPRQSTPTWQRALAGVPGLAGVSLQAEKSTVFEELNLAWARHELISDGLDEVLEWLDAKRRDGSAKLMAAVKPRRRQSLAWV